MYVMTHVAADYVSDSMEIGYIRAFFKVAGVAYMPVYIFDIPS